MGSIALSVIANHVPLVLGLFFGVASLGCLAVGAFWGEQWARSLWKTAPIASILIGLCYVGATGLIAVEIYGVYLRTVPQTGTQSGQQGNCGGNTGNATASGSDNVANSGNCANIDTTKKAK